MPKVNDKVKKEIEKFNQNINKYKRTNLNGRPKEIKLDKVTDLNNDIEKNIKKNSSFVLGGRTKIKSSNVSDQGISEDSMSKDILHPSDMTGSSPRKMRSLSSSDPLKGQASMLTDINKNNSSLMIRLHSEKLASDTKFQKSATEYFSKISKQVEQINQSRNSITLDFYKNSLNTSTQILEELKSINKTVTSAFMLDKDGNRKRDVVADSLVKDLFSGGPLRGKAKQLVMSLGKSAVDDMFGGSLFMLEQGLSALPLLLSGGAKGNMTSLIKMGLGAGMKKLGSKNRAFGTANKMITDPGEYFESIMNAWGLTQGGVKGFLGKKLGTVDKNSSDVNLKDFMHKNAKDKQGFDSMAHTALTRVITRGLANIESALSGNPVLLYNYSTNRYETVAEIEKLIKSGKTDSSKYEKEFATTLKGGRKYKKRNKFGGGETEVTDAGIWGDMLAIKNDINNANLKFVQEAIKVRGEELSQMMIKFIFYMSKRTSDVANVLDQNIDTETLLQIFFTEDELKDKTKINKRANTVIQFKMFIEAMRDIPISKATDVWKKLLRAANDVQENQVREYDRLQKQMEDSVAGWAANAYQKVKTKDGKTRLANRQEIDDILYGKDKKFLFDDAKIGSTIDLTGVASPEELKLRIRMEYNRMVSPLFKGTTEKVTAALKTKAKQLKKEKHPFAEYVSKLAESLAKGKTEVFGDTDYAKLAGIDTYSDLLLHKAPKFKADDPASAIKSAKDIAKWHMENNPKARGIVNIASASAYGALVAKMAHSTGMTNPLFSGVLGMGAAATAVLSGKMGTMVDIMTTSLGDEKMLDKHGNETNVTRRQALKEAAYREMLPKTFAYGAGMKLGGWIKNNIRFGGILGPVIGLTTGFILSKATGPVMLMAKFFGKMGKRFMNSMSHKITGDENVNWGDNIRDLVRSALGLAPAGSEPFTTKEIMKQAQGKGKTTKKSRLIDFFTGRRTPKAAKGEDKKEKRDFAEEYYYKKARARAAIEAKKAEAAAAESEEGKEESPLEKVEKEPPITLINVIGGHLDAVGVVGAIDMEAYKAKLAELTQGVRKSLANAFNDPAMKDRMRSVMSNRLLSVKNYVMTDPVSKHLDKEQDEQEAREEKNEENLEKIAKGGLGAKKVPERKKKGAGLLGALIAGFFALPTISKWLKKLTDWLDPEKLLEMINPVEMVKDAIDDFFHPENKGKKKKKKSDDKRPGESNFGRWGRHMGEAIVKTPLGKNIKGIADFVGTKDKKKYLANMAKNAAGEMLFPTKALKKLGNTRLGKDVIKVGKNLANTKLAKDLKWLYDNTSNEKMIKNAKWLYGKAKGSKLGKGIGKAWKGGVDLAKKGINAFIGEEKVSLKVIGDQMKDTAKQAKEAMTKFGKAAIDKFVKIGEWVMKALDKLEPVLMKIPGFKKYVGPLSGKFIPALKTSMEKILVKVKKEAGTNFGDIIAKRSGVSALKSGLTMGGITAVLNIGFIAWDAWNGAKRATEFFKISDKDQATKLQKFACAITYAIVSLIESIPYCSVVAMIIGSKDYLLKELCYNVYTLLDSMLDTVNMGDNTKEAQDQKVLQDKLDKELSSNDKDKDQAKKVELAQAINEKQKQMTRDGYTQMEINAEIAHMTKQQGGTGSHVSGRPATGKSPYFFSQYQLPSGRLGSINVQDDGCSMAVMKMIGKAINLKIDDNTLMSKARQYILSNRSVSISYFEEFGATVTDNREDIKSALRSPNVVMTLLISNSGYKHFVAVLPKDKNNVYLGDPQKDGWEVIPRTDNKLLAYTISAAVFRGGVITRIGTPRSQKGGTGVGGFGSTAKAVVLKTMNAVKKAGQKVANSMVNIFNNGSDYETVSSGTTNNQSSGSNVSLGADGVNMPHGPVVEVLDRAKYGGGGKDNIVKYQDGTIAKRHGTVGYRMFNPDSSDKGSSWSQQKFGAIPGPSYNRQFTFPSVAASTASLTHQLFEPPASDEKRRDWTAMDIPTMVHTYAPKEEGNNEELYKKTITSLTGLPLGTKLKDVPKDKIPSYIFAIRKMEIGADTPEKLQKFYNEGSNGNSETIISQGTGKVAAANGAKPGDEKAKQGGNGGPLIWGKGMPITLMALTKAHTGSDFVGGRLRWSDKNRTCGLAVGLTALKLAYPNSHDKFTPNEIKAWGERTKNSFDKDYGVSQRFFISLGFKPLPIDKWSGGKKDGKGPFVPLRYFLSGKGSIQPGEQLVINTGDHWMLLVRTSDGSGYHISNPDKSTPELAQYYSLYNVYYALSATSAQQIRNILNSGGSAGGMGSKNVDPNGGSTGDAGTNPDGTAGTDANGNNSSEVSPNRGTSATFGGWFYKDQNGDWHQIMFGNREKKVAGAGQPGAGVTGGANNSAGGSAPWIAEAERLVGKSASDPEIKAFTKGEQSWCALFVSHCLETANLGIGMFASSQEPIGNTKFTKLDQPKPGCIIVWTNRGSGKDSDTPHSNKGHIGFYLGPGSSADKIMHISGNTTESATNNGKPSVLKKERSLNSKNKVFNGYYWPKGGGNSTPQPTNNSTSPAPKGGQGKGGDDAKELNTTLKSTSGTASQYYSKGSKSYNTEQVYNNTVTNIRSTPDNSFKAPTGYKVDDGKEGKYKSFSMHREIDVKRNASLEYRDYVAKAKYRRKMREINAGKNTKDFGVFKALWKDNDDVISKSLLTSASYLTQAKTKNPLMTSLLNLTGALAENAVVQKYGYEQQIAAEKLQTEQLKIQVDTTKKADEGISDYSKVAKIMQQTSLLANRQTSTENFVTVMRDIDGMGKQNDLFQSNLMADN